MNRQRGSGAAGPKPISGGLQVESTPLAPSRRIHPLSYVKKRKQKKRFYMQNSENPNEDRNTQIRCGASQNRGRWGRLFRYNLALRLGKQERWTALSCRKRSGWLLKMSARAGAGRSP